MGIEVTSDREDRISEVYKGSLWSDRLTDIARARIDWMCNQAVGRRVLDVGCSQGITSILLARTGFEVTGIDIFPGAIAYAEADVAKEPEAVRQRLRFALSSLEKFDPERAFDTVILGEVLEHQEHPEVMVRQSIQRLKVGGKLVLTTPFGFEPHADHRAALFPGWFRQFSDSGLSFQEVDVRNNYIFVAATLVSQNDQVNPLNLNNLLKLTERGTLNAQKRLYGYIKDRSKKISEIEKHEVNLRNEFEAREVAMLREWERAVFKDRAARSRLQVLEKSVRYRVGQTIVQACSNPSHALKLPFSLFHVVRVILAERRHKSQISEYESPPVELATSGPVSLFLKRKTQWAESPVLQKKRYRISGVVNSAREEKKKGALLLVQFFDSTGTAIPIATPPFVWQSKSERAICYLETGKAVEFSAEVAAPENATLLRIGFERFGETPPINVQLTSVRELEANAAMSEPLGLTSLGSDCRRGSLAIREGEGREGLPVMGVILDEFTRDCLSPEINIIPVSKRGWQEELAEQKLFGFFAESAWRGNDGQWNYAMTKPEKWGKELDEILAWCRDNNVPSIFWNKEDPANFDVFKTVAKKFDHIFTTDSGCLAAYRQLTENKDNVHTLAFAAQPILHNPIRFSSLTDRFAFTGSWRGVKYPRRAEWLDMLLTPVMERNLLDIFDRYADERNNPDLIFPEKFQPALRGALAYTDLVSQVYKRYLAFINVNSVDSSETMLARRVFEILACGAPVISSPSPAIESIFGDVVLTPKTTTEVADVVDKMIGEPLYRDRLGVQGVRLVHSHHTYRHRLEQISDAVGKPFISKNRKKVSILCCSKRPAFLTQLAEQVLSQTYPDREVVFVAHSSGFSDDSIAEAFRGLKELKILHIDSEKVLADGLNLAMQAAQGDFFTKFDDDDRYGPNYLSDAMLAFDYAPAAGVVGKQSFFAFVQSRNQTVLRFPGNAYRFAKRVHGGTLTWARRKTEGINFTSVRQGTDTIFLKACVDYDVPIFSSDPFNFVHIRYADANEHTWKISDDDFGVNTDLVGNGLLLDKVLV